MIEEKEREAAKQQMIAASFTAWQMGDTGMDFQPYLKKLGLSDIETELTEEQKKFITARSLDIAERINVAYKAGKIYKG